MLAFGGNGIGNKSVAFGTTITFLVPPSGTTKPGRTRISKCVYTAAGTAHTLTFLRPINKTTASSAAASGQAVINLTADPGVTGNLIAANDLLAVRETDGVTRLYVVSSVSSLAITLTGNLTAGAAAGAKVWNFGIVSDTDPAIGMAHPSLRGIASATTTYSDTDAGLFAGHENDSPILFSSNNATATGTLEQLNWAYTAG